MDILNTVIIQPPLVQLNTPYPSGAYLRSFFNKFYESNGIKGSAEWLDLSIELFHRIFSRKGISFIFEKCSARALGLADSFESGGDDNSAFQLRRYVSQSTLWTDWMDIIVSIVCGKSSFSGREFVHEFVRSAHVPRGSRMERYLASLGREVGADDSQILASLALADFADFITAVYDKDFALIRYAERLAVSTAEFSGAERGLDSPVLNDFYRPLLLEKLKRFEGKKTLFCVSVPFPGTFEAALFTGRLIKQLFGSDALVAFGGGYVNTELRNVTEHRLFNYCDFLSYDKGYGSYAELFENDFLLDGRQFYKIKYFYDGKIIDMAESSVKYEGIEHAAVRSVIPDFSGIDFTDYPRLADDTNAMHRIWNDGAWIKAYMAYGCYWHRCAFCDTTLDYVKGFCNIDTAVLYDGLHTQARKTGVYGIHFVDEACPPRAMKEFALKNCAANPRLSWWGNIRFEKTFTRDFADLLSYGGLTAVSGGIEIATGGGLDCVNKGTSIEHIIHACCAFKEAGILVHSYMIFGFWNQSEQDLINSMETLRQMFESGLLDSAFWHKFSLTLHSTVYREWKEGMHKELCPVPASKNQFAENTLSFKGEEKSQKYSEALNRALELWMHGEKLKKGVESYFPFKMPRPTIAGDFVEKLIAGYENNRDMAFAGLPSSGGKEQFVWLGGNMIVLEGNSSLSVQLCWSYMGELLYADTEKNTAAEKAGFINKISAVNYSSASESFNAGKILEMLGKKLFLQLRGKGLCAL